MNDDNALVPLPESIIEKLALNGDVSGLKPAEKIAYYKALCQRVGLDPATQPFKLLRMNGKEVFYCDRGGAAQLNRLHSVSHTIVSREVTNDCYVVTARATTENRHMDSLGAVPINGLKGEALCNAYMKSETKAKRRATLDLLGLGMLDETEVTTIPGAQPLPLPHGPAASEYLPEPPPTAPQQKPGVNTPPTPEKPVSSQPRASQTRFRPTNDSKWKMIGELKAGDGEVNRDLVTRFFKAAGVLPVDKEIENLSLNHVPGSAKQMRDLGEAIAKFDAGEPAVMPFHHDLLKGLAEEVGAKRGNDVKPSWKNHVLLWGSLKGTPLGQLPTDVLMDLYGTFSPSEDADQAFNEKNRQLREALDAAGVEKGWKRE